VSAVGSLGVGLLGVGSALPRATRDNAFFEAAAKRRSEKLARTDVLTLDRAASGASVDLAPEIRDAIAALGDPVFLGARTRHVLGDDEDVSDLEAEAARRALADAGVAPVDVDALFVSSLPGDRLIPSNAPALQQKLGLANAWAVSLDAGCASVPPQLVAAAALVRSGAARRVLVVQSQCGSRVVAPDHPQAIGFGDGASAAVVGVVPDGYGLLASFVRTDGSYRDGIVLAPVGDEGPERRFWRAGPLGPLRMATFDADVGKLAGQRGPAMCEDTCREALRQAGLTTADVALYLGNQSVGWFVDACRRALGLPPERVFETFAEVGNIGSATVLHNLVEARARGRVRDGDVVLMYSPGAGFTRAAAVLRWWSRGGGA
jgi:3-oxoacyl-[acyl-carrier-protein] synthase-3